MTVSAAPADPPAPQSPPPSALADLGLTCKQCGSARFTTQWQKFANGTRHVRVNCGECGAFARWLPQKVDGTADYRMERSELPPGHPARLPVPQSYQWIGMIRQDDGVWLPVTLCGSLAAVWDALLTVPGEGDRLCYPTAPTGGKVCER